MGIPESAPSADAAVQAGPFASDAVHDERGHSGSDPLFEHQEQGIASGDDLPFCQHQGKDKEARKILPSRGMNMVCGRINGQPFQAAAEPDGSGGHWLGWKKKTLQ
jgi:hypothetical protein